MKKTPAEQELQRYEHLMAETTHLMIMEYAEQGKFIGKTPQQTWDLIMEITKIVAHSIVYNQGRVEEGEVDPNNHVIFTFVDQARNILLEKMKRRMEAGSALDAIDGIVKKGDFGTGSV